MRSYCRLKIFLSKSRRQRGQGSRLVHQRTRVRIPEKTWMSNCPSLAPPEAERFCAKKLVDGRCQAQSPVALVDLDVRFRGFLRNSRKYGKDPLERPPRRALHLQAQVPSETISLNTYTHTHPVLFFVCQSNFS